MGISSLACPKLKHCSFYQILNSLFANLYLCDFDIAVKRHGLECVRYADDLVFFSKSARASAEIHDFCRSHLQLQGLRIPEPGDRMSKTKIVSPEKAVEFLGISIDRLDGGKYVAKIPKDQRSAIRESILQFADIDYLSKNQITIKNYAQKLFSTVIGYEAAYEECIDINDFRISLNQWAHKALKRLMCRQFNVQYEGFTDKQKRFLRIDFL